MLLTSRSTLKRTKIKYRHKLDREDEFSGDFQDVYEDKVTSELMDSGLYGGSSRSGRVDSAIRI